MPSDPGLAENHTAHARRPTPAAAEDSPTVGDAPSGPPLAWLLGAYAVSALALYLFVSPRYRPKHIDDAWTLSLAHNFFYNGVTKDLVFENPWGGLALFGKTYAWLYGGVLHALGWTRENAYHLSTLLTLGATGLWAGILLTLGFGPRVTAAAVALMLVLEPFFGVAAQARADALTFLCASLSFLLFVRRRFFVAGLVAMVGLETHPMGLMAFVYMAAYVAAVPPRSPAARTRFLASMRALSVGIAGGLGYYLWLHGEGLGHLASNLAAATAGHAGVDNYLYHYFLETKYLRHLPELALFVTAAAVYGKKRWFRDDPFVATLLLAVVLSTLLVPRPNFLYAVYAFPAFVLVTTYVAERLGRLRAVLAVALALLVAQYALIGYWHRHFRFPDLVRQLQVAIPADDLPVFGSHNEWFALRRRQFLRFELVPQKTEMRAFYVIETDEVRRAPGVERYLRSTCALTPVGAFTHDGELYRVVRCDRHPPVARDGGAGPPAHFRPAIRSGQPPFV